MKPIRIVPIALLCGALSACAVYSQPPGYGAPPSAPPYQNNPQGYDDRGYDNSPRVDIGFFYDELSPYGDWVMTSDLGWAWFPRDVNPYWRPYTQGRWANSEYGWTWVSDEPFGWATYHYGRWAMDSRYGWIWVPGTIWGPAWVSWQSGGGYIGWAPLPPQVGFEVGVGIQLGGFNLSIGIRPDWYNFVPERSFLDPRLSGYMLPPARNVTIINNTTNITNYTYIDNRVINRGIDVGRIERVTGRHVQAYRVAESNSRQRTEVTRDEIRIYRPDKQRLDTVRAAPRLNAGQRPEQRPQDKVRGADRPNAPDVVVAPRAEQAPRSDVRRIDQQTARDKQALERYQADEKKKIDKLHNQELSNARADADRAQVEKRHQAELEALQQEQRDAAQQLEARQKAKREAVVVTPPPGKATSPDEKKAADQQDKKKAAQQQKDKQHGKDKKPEPPPPPAV